MSQDFFSDKTLQYGKTLVSFSFHLLISLVSGPIIAVILYLSYFLSLQQSKIVISAINEDRLIGYWLLIISILIFGLVWLGFFNKRKSVSLSELKCQRWYYEFWNALMNNIQDVETIPALPTVAGTHIDVNRNKMDKSLPNILGVLILAGMAPIMAFLSYYSSNILTKVTPGLVLNEYQWLIGTLFWLVIFLACLIVLFYWLRKNFFLVNVEHYSWKQFWVQLILVTLTKDKMFQQMNGLSDRNSEKLMKTFSENFPAINKKIDEIFDQQKTLNVDQIEWLEEKMEYFENTPGFIYPPSISNITKFYGYALIIAGSLSSLLVEPARFVLENIVNLFI